jgi:hypothetical protein
MKHLTHADGNNEISARKKRGRRHKKQHKSKIEQIEQVSHRQACGGGCLLSEGTTTEARSTATRPDTTCVSLRISTVAAVTEMRGDSLKRRHLLHLSLLGLGRYFSQKAKVIFFFATTLPLTPTCKMYP